MINDSHKKLKIGSGAGNRKYEIMQQMAYIREWGAQFIVPIPSCLAA